LKRLWKRLRELQQQKLSRDELLLKLGAAKADAGYQFSLGRDACPAPQEEVHAQTFTFFEGVKRTV
jgi:hypothetical protein